MCSTSTRSTEVQEVQKTEVQYYYIISQKYKYFASGRLATATMKSAPGWHNHNHNHKNMARQKKGQELSQRRILFNLHDPYQ